jgi:phosphoglycolate phosphatase/pyrophosphatase PpaX
MMVQGLIFDLDGTLADNVQLTCETLGEAASAYSGRAIPPEEVRARFGPSEEGILAQLVGDAWPPATERYFALYRQRWATQAGPSAGLEELLAGLRARGIRVGVVTGRGVRGTALTLEFLGIANQLPEWIAGTPEGADKPGGLRALCARWGLSPHQVGYVGDAPADMAAAQTVGVLPLGAAWCATADATALHRAGAQHVFTSTPELLQWVDQDGATQDAGAS